MFPTNLANISQAVCIFFHLQIRRTGFDRTFFLSVSHYFCRIWATMLGGGGGEARHFEEMLRTEVVGSIFFWGWGPLFLWGVNKKNSPMLHKVFVPIINNTNIFPPSSQVIAHHQPPAPARYQADHKVCIGRVRCFDNDNDTDNKHQLLYCHCHCGFPNSSLNEYIELNATAVLIGSNV